MLLSIRDIRTDGGTQPRAALDTETIADYADEMRAGAIFPPVVVFHDGTEYWLADGFHRLHAAQQLGAEHIEAEVHQGSQEDARWYSYGVNKSHGLRRTNEDKRRAVEAALTHPYHNRYSNREIARHCGVDEGTIRRYRNICGNSADAPRLVMRNGTNYEMDTAGIGRTSTPLAPALLSTVIDTLPTLIVEQLPGDDVDESLNDGAPILDDAPPVEPATSRLAVHFSSKTDQHNTPKLLLPPILATLGAIDLDPCSDSAAAPNIPARVHYTEADNGLVQRWFGRVYMNPPYGRVIGEWTSRLCHEYANGQIDAALALLPARPDTDWFAPLFEHLICFLHGRLTFGDADANAPFPSVMVYLGDNDAAFIDAFRPLGAIVRRVS